MFLFLKYIICLEVRNAEIVKWKFKKVSTQESNLLLVRCGSRGPLHYRIHLPLDPSSWCFPAAAVARLRPFAASRVALHQGIMLKKTRDAKQPCRPGVYNRYHAGLAVFARLCVCQGLSVQCPLPPPPRLGPDNQAHLSLLSQ